MFVLAIIWAVHGKYGNTHTHTHTYTNSYINTFTHKHIQTHLYTHFAANVPVVLPSANNDNIDNDNKSCTSLLVV